MTFDELIDFYGTQVKAGKAIGIGQSSVAEWKEKGIPAGRQAQFELLTNGALKADLPRPVEIEQAA